MDTKALRQKILDLAIRGKLVPQDPNDEPASVLLERIRTQKQQMVHEGKLKPKNIKDETIIFVGEDNLHYEKFAGGTVKCIEDEIPFELPDGWSWERLSNIAAFSSGKTPSTSHREFWDGSVLWVTSKDMKSKYITSSLLMLSEKGASQMQLYPSGTILMVTRSGILRHTLPVAILKKDATVNQDIKAICLYDCSLTEWIYSCLKGMEDRLLLRYTKSGTTVENINFDEFKGVLLPIPPVPEMYHIIDRVQGACRAIDVMDEEKTALEDLVVNAKGRILDLAIRGQLVPQNPDDEPASVLLERIRIEKEELIKQGKVKRGKHESIIFRGEDNSYYERVGQDVVNIAEELPFIIPDSWCWARMSSVFEINPRNRLNDELDVSFIPMPLIEDGFSGRHTSDIKKWSAVKTGFTHFKEGDIGIAKITPCFENRKSTIFHDLVNGFGAGTTELHVLRSFGNLILPEYALAFVKTQAFIDGGKQEFTGAVGQQRVGKEYITEALLPVPPYQEQVRIVEAIKRAFTTICKIENAIV